MQRAVKPLKQVEEKKTAKQNPQTNPKPTQFKKQASPLGARPKIGARPMTTR